MKKLVIILSFIFTLLTLLLYNYYTSQIKIHKEKIYKEKSLELKEQLKKFIKQKQGMTAAITYVLSKKKNVANALAKKDIKLLNCEEILSGLETIGEYKNL